SEETLTDNDIKNLYNKSSLTIIPINESLQPSGQSVALQSMSMGVPVIITKTDGFWEPGIYINEKNIIFAEKNDIEEWTKKIYSVLNDEEQYKQI
ncbi:MAG: glycosyltransferase, partial [Flavobacteriaceae bacterium]